MARNKTDNDNRMDGIVDKVRVQREKYDDINNLEEESGIARFQASTLRLFKEVCEEDKGLIPTTAVIINKDPLHGGGQLLESPAVVLVVIPGLPNTNLYFSLLNRITRDCLSPGLMFGASTKVRWYNGTWEMCCSHTANEGRPGICVYFEHSTFTNKMWVALIDESDDKAIVGEWMELKYPEDYFIAIQKADAVDKSPPDKSCVH